MFKNSIESSGRFKITTPNFFGESVENNLNSLLLNNRCFNTTIQSSFRTVTCFYTLLIVMFCSRQSQLALFKSFPTTVIPHDPNGMENGPTPQVPSRTKYEFGSNYLKQAERLSVFY